jgi:hypothetical protein
LLPSVHLALLVAPLGLAQFALQDLARRTLPLAILACAKGCQAAASFGAFGVISRIR